MRWSLRRRALKPQPLERHSHSLHFSGINLGDLVGLVPDGEAPSTPTDPWRVSRAAALQVPAVKRGRDIIAGTIATLPLVARLADGTERRDLTVLRRPDPAKPYAVMIAETITDLMFDSVAWWHVTSRSRETGRALTYERLEPWSLSLQREPVNITTPYGTTAQAQAWPEDPDIIRFDGVTDPLLSVGARAIRAALRLEAAAAMASDGLPPIDWFEPKDGVDPDDDEVVEFLQAWQTARRTRTTAYVPAAFQYQTSGFNPDQLQLAEARQHAALEIARLMGLDGEDLNISTTSRTYFNAFDRQQDRIRSTLALYFVPIEQRLSMEDMTPLGTQVRFDVSALLRSDDTTRFQAYAAGLQVGVYADKNDVRAAEGLPELGVAPEPVDQAPPAAQAPPVDQFDTVAAATAAAAGMQFAAAEPLFLASPVPAAFAVDEAKRTITGLAVPYGVASGPESVSGGVYRFTRGQLTWPADISRVKLTAEIHDTRRAVGVVTGFEERDQGPAGPGLYATARVAPGAAGDEVLTMAKEGVWDGLSVGLKEAKFARGRDGVYTPKATAPIAHLTVTPSPAFDDARVLSVAASAATNQEGTPMPEAVTTEAPPATSPPVAAPPAPAPVELSAETVAAIGAAFAAALPPAPTDTPVPTGGTRTPVGTQVREQPCYRFDGVRGAHGFAEDIRAALFSGDPDARQRLETQMETHFAAVQLGAAQTLEQQQQALGFAAVTPANVATLRPTVNRPDMYVERLEYDRPLWESVTNGTVTDNVPFQFPKYTAAGNLVGAHTTGTEPSDATFTTTSQTVTPAPMSGRAILPRELIDNGGNPAVDQLLWTMMQGSYFEAIEAQINTTLAAAATAEVNLASAVDEALVDALTAVLITAQYQRGGNRFTRLVLDGTTFAALVNASDTTGRKLLPVIGATNAQGGTGAAFNAVQLGALMGRAAWPLGAGNAAKSYLIAPTDVYAWASAPKRFNFEYQVSTVTLAIWGYSAAAIARDAGVQPIDYTTADS